MASRRLAAVMYSIPTPVLVMLGKPYSPNGLGSPRMSPHFLSSPTLKKFRSSDPTLTLVSEKNVGENVWFQVTTPVSLRMGRQLPLADRSSVIGELLLPDCANESRTPCVYRKKIWSRSEIRWSTFEVKVHSSRLLGARY